MWSGKDRRIVLGGLSACQLHIPDNFTLVNKCSAEHLSTNSGSYRYPRPAPKCSSKSSDIGQQTPRLRPRNLQCVRVIAPHHPLCGQLVPVIRAMQEQGEAQLVIQASNGHHQLIPLRYTEAAPAPAAVAPSGLRLTPGRLCALARMVHSLRSRDAPEVRHVPASPVEHLSARHSSASDSAVEQPARATASGPATASSERSPR
jgi:hypothetical protein